MQEKVREIRLKTFLSCKLFFNASITYLISVAFLLALPFFQNIFDIIIRDVPTKLGWILLLKKSLKFAKLEFTIQNFFVKKIRQNEGRFVLLSQNVSKLSRIFIAKKIRQIEGRSALLSQNVNKLSRIFILKNRLIEGRSVLLSQNVNKLSRFFCRS